MSTWGSVSGRDEQGGWGDTENLGRECDAEMEWGHNVEGRRSPTRRLDREGLGPGPLIRPSQ